MYSVSSASSMPSSSFTTTASSTNWARKSRSTSTLVWASCASSDSSCEAEVGVEVEPVRRQLLLERLATVPDLLLDGSLRQRNLDLAEQCLENVVASLHALLESLHALEPGPQVGAQFVKRVELTGFLGEGVVEGRQLLGTNAADRDRRAPLCGREWTTERRVELGRLPRRQAQQRGVEPVDQPLGADLVRQTGRGAVFDRLSVRAEA